MNLISPLSARQEWASMWPVPLVAMLGTCGSTMFAYSGGVFMGPITAAFGWSHTEFSTTYILQMLSGLFVLPALGWLADQVGPRRVALLGIIAFAVAFSLLGLVNGSIWEWWLLCLLVAITQGPVSTIIWVTGVIGRFHASRGFAMAVVLAGLGLGTLVWPLLSAFYVGALGWRLAFPALAIGWAVIVFPLTAAFFFGAPQPALVNRPTARPGSYALALKSRTFVCLMIAGGLYASAYYGVLVNFVPILQSKGLGLTAAAGVAGIAGVFAVTGRLVTGYLLDRLPARPVAVVAFLLPAAASVLLLNAHGSATKSLVAVMLFGLSSGAETDVITFIAARRFGPKVFASIYGIFMAVIAVCASSGPIIAGTLFDDFKSYDVYLTIVPVMMIVGTALFAWIPIEPSGAFGEPVEAVV